MINVELLPIFKLQTTHDNPTNLLSSLYMFKFYLIDLIFAVERLVHEVHLNLIMIFSCGVVLFILHGYPLFKSATSKVVVMIIVVASRIPFAAKDLITFILW